MPPLTLCWLRRDLRLSDSTALQEASQGPFVVGFIFDRCILDELEDSDDRRVTFIHRSLEEVRQGIERRGGQLWVGYGDPVEVIPRWAQQGGLTRVVAAHDDDPYALRRDAQVQARLKDAGVEWRSVKDHVLLERQEVLTQSGTPHKVFTPYQKAWLGRLTAADLAERTVHWPHLQAARSPDAPDRSLDSMGFRPGALWLEPGESGGQRRLADFLARVPKYHEARDLPALEATSGLSVHLRFGTLSIRQCVRALGIATPDQVQDLEPGPRKWLSELVWREFYHNILANFPHVVDGAFRREFDALEWPGLPEHFEAWKAGRTGYPIVDAAMRCLNQTGWMHNRLRMVAASFLTKDLLVSYRLGEAYFARQLLDFDLAQNNGGWQWTASTGTDAQPTYRIFNPILQSLKFDSEGAFIRRFCPELAELDPEAIHTPWQAPPMTLLAAGVRLGENYPFPIVDHAVQRAKALALLGSVSAQT